MATSLTEGLQNALTFLLARMAHLRRCDDAWGFLLDGSPLENARMLFFSTPHHLTGRTESKVTNMPCSSSGLHAAEMALVAVEESAASVNTCWYSVPYRSYGSVSCGVIISESEDTLDLLSLNHAFRHARYARNDTTGDYLTVHLDKEGNFVEIYYLAPISVTERKRALLRFDYAPFMAATRNHMDAALCVSKLLDAVRSCHIVSEYRNCPQPRCNINNTSCRCALKFHAPEGPFDLRRNTLNMLDQQGEYVGFSYHFDRENNILKEFFNKCRIVGGTGGGMNRSQRLITLAIQRYLKDLPVIPHSKYDIESDMHAATLMNHIAYGQDQYQNVVQNGNVALSGHTTSTSIQSHPIPTATSSEVSSICIPTPPSENYFLDPPNTNILPGDTVQMAMASPLNRPSVTIPAAARAAGVSTPGISKKAKSPKSGPKRRGRRPRVPVQKPPQPVLIAPKAITCPSAPSMGELYGGFQTQEEYKNYCKKLRSRESAARANERRREKRKRELQLQQQQKKRTLDGGEAAKNTP